MPDLSTSTVSELIAELRRQRDQIDTALAEFSTTADIIERAVIRTFNTTRKQLHNLSRASHIALPRQAAMTLMHEHGLTWQQASSHYGLDYGTAMHASKAISTREATDPDFASKMHNLRINISKTLQRAKISQTSVQKLDSAP